MKEMTANALGICHSVCNFPDEFFNYFRMNIDTFPYINKRGSSGRY